MSRIVVSIWLLIFSNKSFPCHEIDWIAINLPDIAAWDARIKEWSKDALLGVKSGEDSFVAVQDLYSVIISSINIEQVYVNAINKNISCSEAKEFYQWREKPPEAVRKVEAVLRQTAADIEKSIDEKFKSYISVYSERIYNGKVSDDSSFVGTVVANIDLKPGDTITTKSAAIRKFNIDTIYVDALLPDEFDFYSGLTVTVPINAGDQIRKEYLSEHPNKKEIDRLISEIGKLNSELSKARMNKK